MDWNSVQTTVVLPRWIWNEAKDADHFEKLISEYMKKSYPGYKVKRLGKYYAVCERPMNN